MTVCPERIAYAPKDLSRFQRGEAVTVSELPSVVSSLATALGASTLNVISPGCVPDGVPPKTRTLKVTSSEKVPALFLSKSLRSQIIVCLSAEILELAGLHEPGNSVHS